MVKTIKKLEQNYSYFIYYNQVDIEYFHRNMKFNVSSKIPTEKLYKDYTKIKTRPYDLADNYIQVSLSFAIEFNQSKAKDIIKGKKDTSAEKYFHIFLKDLASILNANILTISNSNANSKNFKASYTFLIAELSSRNNIIYKLKAVPYNRGTEPYGFICELTKIKPVIKFL